MNESKPMRVKGDPKGYVVVETTDGKCCEHCAFDKSGRCCKIPCMTIHRPDGKEIYYVKKGTKK